MAPCAPYCGYRRASARAWYHSPEYASALEVRDAALSRSLILVEGMPAGLCSVLAGGLSHSTEYPHVRLQLTRCTQPTRKSWREAGDDGLWDRHERLRFAE